MNLDELKSLLGQFHIRPDKRLGQNFLLSDEVLDKIVDAAELTTQDMVLEIGPGLGALTRRLSEKAGQVIAIEKDRKIFRALKTILKRQENVKLIFGDALSFDPTSHPLLSTNYKLVANIPYYLTGKIIQDFLTAKAKPQLLVLLLQKEVARRIVAEPGEMSLLSVATQFYSDPELVGEVPKADFYPAPAVDSAIVRFRVLREPRFVVNEKKFFQLVKIGFANKRKQLHNNLATGLGANYDFKKILTGLKLNPLVRAEDLSLANWQQLYTHLFS